MYETTVMSLLTAHGEPKGIESLRDLLRPQNSHMRMYVRDDGFEIDYLRGQPHFKELEPKIDYVNFNMLHIEHDSAKQVMSNVLAGSHVLLASSDNFAASVCKVSEWTETVYAKGVSDKRLLQGDLRILLIF